MVFLADGVKIDMRWRSISYIKNGKKLVFYIEPMMDCLALIYFPSEESWNSKQDFFSLEDRLEIIELFENIQWNRSIAFVMGDIVPLLLDEDAEIISPGTLEDTVAGRKIEGDALFDPDSSLESQQVQEIYLTLEKRHAAVVEGKVTLRYESLIPNSVFSEVIIPELERNKNITIVKE